MCGILAVWGLTGDARENWKRIRDLSRRLRHRGPDAAHMHVRVDPDTGLGTYFVHKRLALVAPGDGGNQPLFAGEDDHIAWVANGEIYNHADLRSKHDLKTPHESDCAVIGELYEKFGPEFVRELDGMFAFALEDAETGAVCAARDHMGKIPLYIGHGHDGSVWFASEMKALIDDPGIERYEIFPPGHVFTKGPGDAQGTMTRFYDPRWVVDEEYVPTTPLDLEQLRSTVVDACVKRLMTDVPYGVLLSGGLDSSLITSIAQRHCKEAENAFKPFKGSSEASKSAIAQYEEALKDADPQSLQAQALRTAIEQERVSLENAEKYERVKSFSIGIKGAPDLAAARKVADFLGTDHHELYFTPQEALEALPDVIWHLESFEQVRASVPMYLLSRKIKAYGIKMVLSGEGADEAFGGYLYFHKAPNPAEFHKECVRKTTRLHQWDVLRANKATMAWGLEVRTPLLSRQVLELAMNMDPKEKMIDMEKFDEDGRPHMEKYPLRKAFDDLDRPYLPESVLWRQKEQFSDGVGYDWVDSLKEFAESEVSDEEFEARATRFPDNPPETKEYYLLRSIFEKHFVEGLPNGKCATATVPVGKSIACSTPEAVAWDPEWEKTSGDISGRAVQGVHVAGDDFSFDVGEVTASRAAPFLAWEAQQAAHQDGLGSAQGARQKAGIRAMRQPGPGRTVTPTPRTGGGNTRRTRGRASALRGATMRAMLFA